MKKCLGIFIAALILLISGCTPALNITETPCNAVEVMDPWFPSHSFDSAPAGLGIRVTSAEKGMEFVLTAQNGCFWIQTPCATPKTVRLLSGESIGWMHYLPDSAGSESWKGDTTYVDILMRQEGVVVGYAVARITNNGGYEGEVLKCVTLEGDTPTEAWLKKAMEDAKK